MKCTRGERLYVSGEIVPTSRGCKEETKRDQSRGAKNGCRKRSCTRENLRKGIRRSSVIGTGKKGGC
jgi:hypothetical protein